MKTPQQIGDELITQGAVLFIRSIQDHILIGHWEWLDDHRVFYYDAGSSDEFGGHLLEFSKAEAPHDLGVMFLGAGGEIVAYLTTREEADLNDPNAYAIGWIHWQDVAASMQPFIQEVKTSLLD